MPIQHEQLRQLITDVLKIAKLYSRNAVELLMMTAAQESHCGDYIEQLDPDPTDNYKPPALGIFQMEPATHYDIWNNYLVYKQPLADIANKFVAHDLNLDMNLKANLPYQIIMARIHYIRKPGLLPNYNDIDAMAMYYKKYWNTYKGKATAMEAKTNYMRYAI